MADAPGASGALFPAPARSLENRIDMICSICDTIFKTGGDKPRPYVNLIRPGKNNYTLKKDRKDKEVELGTVLWVYFLPFPK